MPDINPQNDHEGYRRHHTSNHHKSAIRRLVVMENLGQYLEKILYGDSFNQLTVDQQLELAKRIIECAKERREIYDRLERKVNRIRPRFKKKPQTASALFEGINRPQ